MTNDLKNYIKKPLILNTHRDVNIRDIFDVLEIDSCHQFIFKDHSDKSSFWYSDYELRKLYDYNSLSTEFIFSREGLPSRCKKAYEELCELFKEYLLLSRKSVATRKLKNTLLIFFKNVSRLKYHNKYSLRYRSLPKSWKGVNRGISRAYFLEFIEFLKSREDAINLTGFRIDDGSSATSLLILNPNFIDYCNCDNPVKIEEEFRSVDGDSVVIHKDHNYDIILSKEERIMAGKLEKMMEVYNEKLKEVTVKANGFDVPETFFRRVFSGDFSSGGRFYETKSSIQKSPESVRKTVTIDGEPTVEKDYKYLHVAMAYEEKGIQFEKDPYNFDLDIEVDEKAISRWCKTNGINKDTYDPVRNFKKTVLLVLMNATGVESAISGIRYNVAKDFSKKLGSSRKFVGIVNAPVKEAVKKAMEYHKDISEYFCSGVGIRFQNLDSKMVEYCISQFLKMDEVLFPVHDSLIIKSSCSDKAEQIMTDAYEFVMGSKLNCKIK